MIFILFSPYGGCVNVKLPTPVWPATGQPDLAGVPDAQMIAVEFSTAFANMVSVETTSTVSTT